MYAYIYILLFVEIIEYTVIPTLNVGMKTCKAELCYFEIILRQQTTKNNISYSYMIYDTIVRSHSNFRNRNCKFSIINISKKVNSKMPVFQIFHDELKMYIKSQVWSLLQQINVYTWCVGMVGFTLYDSDVHIEKLLFRFVNLVTFFFFFLDR